MYRDRGRAQQLDSSPSPGAFNKDIEIEWVGNRHVGEIQGSLGPRSASTTSSNVDEMTKPASGGSTNGGGLLGSMSSDAVSDEGVPQIGSISLESMSPPARSLTPWHGISGELARNAPNYMSRIHGRAAPDHGIVNEKAVRIAITETATE